MAQQTSLNDLLSNAVTQAQQIANAAGTYGDANVKSYFSNFDGNLIPAANVTYSLGSSTRQWKDLWVSNNTIYIGNTPVRVSNGQLLVNNAPVTGDRLTNGNTEVVLEAASLVRFPSYYDASLFLQGNEIGSVNSSVVLSATDDLYINANIQATARQWKFDADGNLILPANGHITYSNGTNILSGLGGGGSIGNFQFENNNLYSSTAGEIWIGNGRQSQEESTAQLRLPDTSGGDIYIQNTTGGGIQLAAASGSLSIAATGQVVVGSSSINGLSPSGYIMAQNDLRLSANDQAIWKFGTDGNLTLPSNSLQILYANGTSILSGLGGGGVSDHITNGEFTAEVDNSGYFRPPYNAFIGNTQAAVIYSGVNLALRTVDQNWFFDNTGTLTAPGDIRTEIGRAHV